LAEHLPDTFFGRCKVRELVPYEQRLAMDRAIIERGPGHENREKIWRAFSLKEYGIGLKAFRRYAERIEQEGRDYFLAALLGTLFGRLDGSKRAGIYEAAQTMVASLLLKVVRAQREEVGLEGLAKLVRMNLDLRKAAAIRLGEVGPGAEGETGETAAEMAEEMRERVRQLYGTETVEEMERQTAERLEANEGDRDDGEARGE
jgi:hypothetical protein